MALLDLTNAPHGGSQRHLPEWQSQPRITPTTIIDHSIVGTGESAFRLFRDSSALESHFIVCGAGDTDDGWIWQLMDTDRRADANLDANAYAISIETGDQGDPDRQPWTDRQLGSLAWLHDELRRIHPTIPRRESRSCADPAGLGFHTLHGAPSCWTPSIKSCPGAVRKQQWRDVLLPAYLTDQEVDMPLDQADHDAIVADVRKALTTTLPGTISSGSVASIIKDVQGGVDRMEPTLNAVKAAIDAGLIVTLSDDQLLALAEALAPLIAGHLEVAGHPVLVTDGPVRLVAEIPSP